MQKIKKLKNYPGWKPKINFVKELSNILKNILKLDVETVNLKN